MNDGFYLDTLIRAIEDVFEHRRSKPSDTVYKAGAFRVGRYRGDGKQIIERGSGIG